MTKITWDGVGERQFETGVDHGVLYLANNGVYDEGHAWNGLTSVTEKPTGAAATPIWADNVKYLNLISREDFGADISAHTYPDEFEQCDGTASPHAGVAVHQQSRRTFGLSYRTLLGDDLSGRDAGYKLHLVYGATASVSDRAYNTVNDTPEAIAFNWTVTTVQVPVTGYKPTALLTIKSNKVDPDQLNALLDALYGTAGSDPRLPLPDEVIAMFAADPTTATPAAPTYNGTTHVITVPTTTGVVYRRSDNNAVVSGSTITLTPGQELIVTANPANGYRLDPNLDNDWGFTY